MSETSGSGLKQAVLWEKKGALVHCFLCYRNCFIPEGKRGFCGVRENRGGTLVSLVYGKAASTAIDPVEKKPFFHFWPGSQTFSFATVGCNFRCDFCQNWEISQPSQIFGEDLIPQEIVGLAKKYGCGGIAYTYTEPTVFMEYCYDTGMLAKKAGLYNAFVSNAYMTPQAVKLAREFLDGCRMDLKGNEKTYRELCGGVVLENVLECIKNVFKAGIHSEIITLVIPGENDNRDFVVMAADFLKKLSPEIPWHFTAFYPTYKLLDRPPTPVKTLEKMHDWAADEGMKYVYAGNAPGHKYENTYCPKCGALAIERKGFCVSKIALTKEKKCLECGQKIPIVGEMKTSC